MRNLRTILFDVFPLAAATVASLALYPQRALLLFSKVGEVYSGVFDTSVPAFPLAGLLFVLFFIALRREELARLLSDRQGRPVVSAAGIAIALLPLTAVYLAGPELGGSYVFAALALATCWVGVTTALRPSAFRFLWPYLLVYLTALSSVGALTTVFGDPLAFVVASISGSITYALGLLVHWSSVYFVFTPSGGSPVSLYISQECSGIASISIFLLLVGLMHLDMKPSLKTSVFVALGGAFLFIFLNSMRVVVLIAGGIYGGADLFWSLHGWVGYVFYVAGYAGILLAFMRLERRGRPSPGVL